MGRFPRRLTDRVESAFRWCAGGLALVLVAAAVLAGLGLESTGQSQAASDASNRVAVQAQLLQPSPGVVGFDAMASAAPATAEAAWTAPDGTPRTGQVPVLGMQPAGTVVSLWVDRTGAVAPPPVVAGQVAVTAVVGGLLVLMVGALALLGLRWLVLARCAAVNARTWARDWALYEPLWSGR